MELSAAQRDLFARLARHPRMVEPVQ